jgi:hypothetical protein
VTICGKGKSRERALLGGCAAIVLIAAALAIAWPFKGRETHVASEAAPSPSPPARASSPSRTRALRTGSLAHEVHYASFLFVGFGLSDPNFNLIRDDARLAMGDNMPASYLAQERPDPVVRGYLDSLEVRTIALESWNAMPLLLNAINPA